jgi:hypothetical protein
MLMGQAQEPVLVHFSDPVHQRDGSLTCQISLVLNH